MTGTVVTDPRWFPPSGPRLALTREQADAELAELSTTVDSISASLLDLENHPGHQLLRSYPQTGETGREWAAVRDAIALLWEDFGRYRSVIESARSVRNRRSRPDPADLAELTALLRGEPVELDSRAVPMSERKLTGPAELRSRIGLVGLTTRMNATFERAGDLVTRVDSIATAVRDGLTPVQLAVAADRRMIEPAAPAGGRVAADPDLVALESIDDRVVELTRRSVSDALSITDPAGEVAAIAADLESLHERLVRSQEVRQAWPEKLAALREVAVQVGAVQQRARVARQQVAATIRTAPLPAGADHLGAVNTRIEELAAVAGWPARIRALGQAQQVAQNALAAATAEEQLASGLLQRRVELKGRLSAYRSKAMRLGRAGEPAAEAQYDRAAAALAAVPCDLAAATTQVAAYQEVVLNPTNRNPGRPA